MSEEEESIIQKSSPETARVCGLKPQWTEISCEAWIVKISDFGSHMGSAITHFVIVNQTWTKYRHSCS